MHTTKYVFLCLSSLLFCAAAKNTTNPPATPSTVIYPLSSDDDFAVVLAGVLAMSQGGAASSGEVLRAASQIVPGDIESFYSEFNFLANATHNMAISVNATKAPSAARSAYFRSAAYSRTADFFLHGNASDPRIITLWDSQLANFRNGVSLLPVPGENITVKGPGYTIPVYFFPAKARHGPGGEKVPTILAGTGYDRAQEDLYHSFGQYVLERGWNFATYEGPGQQTVRRFQNIGFTPDWWNVVTPVVDYLSTRPDVDMEKVALLGECFGGALAPIAASREHRLAAVISLDGLYSTQQSTLASLPSELVKAFWAGNKTLVNEVADLLYKEAVEGELGDQSTEVRWFIDQNLWSFDFPDPFSWLTALGDYTLDGVYANVTCPIFIGDGQNDSVALNQSELAWQSLGDPKKGYYYEFANAYGSGQHCQVGAEPYMNMVVWDWLDGVFEGNWATGNGTTIF